MVTCEGMAGPTTKTVETWRVRGFGPRYATVGVLVRYNESDVHARIKGQSASSSPSASPRGGHSDSGNTSECSNLCNLPIEDIREHQWGHDRGVGLDDEFRSVYTELSPRDLFVRDRAGV